MQIKVGQEYYNTEGFSSVNDLTASGLITGDVLSQKMTLLNRTIRDRSPFMWLNGGQAGFRTPKELTGDGQYTWAVMGAIKEHDVVIGSPYTTGDKPGKNLEPFIVHMKTNFLKEGHFIVFRDKYIGRIDDAPEDKGTYWVYKVRPYSIADKSAFCSLSNLKAGNLIRQSVYAVPDRLDVGTETNSQTPYKRTNQISKLRHTYRITGNISQKKVVTFEFPLANGGTTTQWVDYDYWTSIAQDEFITERFLFEESEYNRDENGVIRLTDRRSGGEPVPTGASIKQMILAEGNDSSYGIDFTLAYWEKTVGDLNYGNSKSVDLIGYAGKMYMQDFSRALETASKNNGYVVAEGAARIVKTSSGLNYDNTNFVQYTTRDGGKVTLIHLPYLDDAGESGQIRHPRTGKPISSHSCFYLGQGVDDNNDPNIQMLCEKGESRVTGIYRGLTNIPTSWGASNTGNMSMINLATERNEASIHVRRSIGVNIRDTTNTFYHYSAFDE